MTSERWQHPRPAPSPAPHPEIRRLRQSRLFLSWRSNPWVGGRVPRRTAYSEPKKPSVRVQARDRPAGRCSARSWSSGCWLSAATHTSTILSPLTRYAAKLLGARAAAGGRHAEEGAAVRARVEEVRMDPAAVHEQVSQVPLVVGEGVNDSFQSLDERAQPLHLAIDLHCLRDVVARSMELVGVHGRCTAGRRRRGPPLPP